MASTTAAANSTTTTHGLLSSELSTASTASTLSSRLRALFPPSLLTRVHSLRFPWPKASPTLTGQAAIDNLCSSNPELDRTLYRLLWPVWKALSEIPLDDLLAIDLPQSLGLDPDGDDEDYPAHCVALVSLLDQTRGFFRGTDMRYTHCFFDPLAAKTAERLFSDQSEKTGIPPPHSPFSSASWLRRGYTFSDYAVRVDWLWSPLIHSEHHLSLSSPHYRAVNRGFILHLRAETEAATRQRDPHTATQAADEEDLYLLSRMTGASGGEDMTPSAENLGRELEVADYVWWILRLNTAHLGILGRWGRYPYQNDQMGRVFDEDTREGEEEWMRKAYPRGRLPVMWREAIRKDVLEGRWTELKGEGEERFLK